MTVVCSLKNSFPKWNNEVFHSRTKSKLAFYIQSESYWDRSSVLSLVGVEHRGDSL